MGGFSSYRNFRRSVVRSYCLLSSFGGRRFPRFPLKISRGVAFKNKRYTRFSAVFDSGYYRSYYLGTKGLFYELSKIDKTNRTMPFIILASLLLSIFCIGYISGVGADGTAFVSLNNIQQIAHRHHHTAVALKKGGTKKKKVQSSTITVNKLAFRNYEVLETWEAGISLVGTEVKRFV